jgi:hypothetical protein
VAEPLSTYSALKTAIARLINRTDLTNDIPGFIRMAEARMFRVLRGHEFTCSRSVTISSGSMSLPCGFRGVVAFRLNNRPSALEFVTPQQMDDKFDAGTSTTGEPRYYAIAGGKFLFSPEPDADYEARLIVTERPEHLSSSNPENWLLEQHPDLYLYASALHAAPLLRDDERIPVWRSFVDQALREIEADILSSQLGAALTPQVRQVV